MLVNNILEIIEIKNIVNLSAFKVKLQVVKTIVSPRLDLISAPDCPCTSQAERRGSYTHEAQLPSYIVHDI